MRSEHLVLQRLPEIRCQFGNHVLTQLQGLCLDRKFPDRLNDNQRGTRYQSCREMLEDLRNYRSVSGAGGNPQATMVLGGQQAIMFGTLIESQFTAAFNWPLGAALGFVLLAMILVVMALFFPLLQSRDPGARGFAFVAITLVACIAAMADLAMAGRWAGRARPACCSSKGRRRMSSGSTPLLRHSGPATRSRSTRPGYRSSTGRWGPSRATNRM